MRLSTPAGTDLWLAYGMNVHTDEHGDTVDGLERALDATVLPLRQRLGATGPFGVSLRLDFPGARRLADDDARRGGLRERLASEGLVPFTANGFVAGRFHPGGTKDSVYRPTWREWEREEYTMVLAEVLASLRGPGASVSISTSPLSFKPFGDPKEAEWTSAERLVVVARRLRALEESTGVRVLLGLEPEPLCTIETVEEAVRFFEGPLRRAFGSETAARRHVGVCYDVCHQAVQREDAAAGLDLLRAQGIPVVKLQASSALEVTDPADPRSRRAIARFDEPRWLHQVVAHRGGRRAAPDLPEALSGPDADGWAKAGPWRVHFHVPVHARELPGGLRTTRDVLDAALARVARGDVTEHVEIETYAWDAIPEDERAGLSLVESLAREYEHVLGVLEAHGAKR